MFKARYFPNTEFLNALVNANGSYVWKSIAVARHVIIKGHCWQVGDEVNIKIWHDNWLPKDSYFKVLSHPPVNWDTEATVDKLIVSHSQNWNVELFQQLFFQEEMERILHIPLSFRTVGDRRVWHYERHGKFSVRSAYHVARDIVSKGGDGVSICASLLDDGRDRLWRKLWNACVPGKVKICA